jgi:hypothetical protein
MELRHLATFRTLATTLNFTQTAALKICAESSTQWPSAQYFRSNLQRNYHPRAQTRAQRLRRKNTSKRIGAASGKIGLVITLNPSLRATSAVLP